MKKTALITGISGQDGSYLANLLLEKGYEVYGIVRRKSIPEHQESRIDYISHKIKTYYGDLLDQSSLERVIKDVNPNEIYNLAAQSHVRISYDIPQYTLQTNVVGTLNLLEAFRNHAPNAKYYQASSSEMFGDSVDRDRCQRETTNMTPVSPYGCSKLCAYSMVRNYRKAYGLFATNGILFNHESPRRGSNFVTVKIIKGALDILTGHSSKLELGNLDSYRDWGHAKDYTRAMHLMLQHDKPDDFVIATGESHSIRELCDIVFSKLGMNYKDYVVQNPKYLRPEELPYLKGDSSKARKILGWKPEYSFKSMIEEMLNHYQSKPLT